MNMRHLLFLTLFTAFTFLVNAQVKTISLKKGEALDLLLLNTNADAKAELDEYFTKAVPVAQKWGYRPQYSCRIGEPPTQGNYWPSTFILAKWEDYDKRIAFTKAILEEYPQFHERRREIWTTFNLTYWQIEEDKEVTIDPEKFYIATSYWGKESNDFKQFESQWSSAVTKNGGNIVLSLKDGASPFGYDYNPDLFTLIEWKDKADFEQFYQDHQNMDHQGVRHVNQFILN